MEGAEVAAATLEKEQLQAKASAMLHEVLADPKTGVQVEALLKGATIALFRDEQFTERAVEWAAKVLADALKWEEVKQQGSAYVTSVFEDPESKRSAFEYLSAAINEVVADERVQDNVGKVSLCFLVILYLGGGCAMRKSLRVILEFSDELRLFGCLSWVQGLWSSVRVSLIGRRRAREEKEKRITDEKPVAENTSKEESIKAMNGLNGNPSPGPREEATRINGNMDSQKSAGESIEPS